LKNAVLALVLILFVGCSGTNKNVAPPPQTPQPESKKQVSNAVLGTYSTRLLDKSKARLKNINLAAEQINKVTLPPGETFSFNETVGPRLENRGFQKAKILIKKEKTMGYGGGICQLSTTIYNAALGAGLEIVERHEHEGEIGYVELGDDATVNYPSLDLKIKNNKAVSIRFNCEMSEDEVIVKIISIQ